MHNGITNEPTPVGRAGLPAELEYGLGAGDHVAYWSYLCAGVPRYLPKRLGKRLKDGLFGFITACFFLGMVTVPLAAIALNQPLLFLGGSLAVFLGGMIAYSVNDKLIQSNRKVFLRPGILAAPCRWITRVVLRKVAAEDVAAGESGPLWRLHFAMTAEGFTSTAERCRTSAGVVNFTSGQAKGPWAAIEHLGITDEHVFLIPADGNAVIVPRQAFADEEQFRQFVEVVRRYHAGAMTGGPAGGTAIMIRSQQVRDVPTAAEDTRISRHIGR
jgi:hypothetical protein